MGKRYVGPAPSNAQDLTTKGYVDGLGGGGGPAKASGAEALAMTDDTKFVTPAGLAAASSAPLVAYSLIRRDDAGRAQVNNPSTALDIANKTYVDGAIPAEASNAEVQAMTDADKFITPAGLASAASVSPTAGRLIRRDGSGNAQIGVPSAADDIANKQYVDAIKTNTLGGLSFVKLTQAAYTALGTKDPNTVYFIVG